MPVDNLTDCTDSFFLIPTFVFVFRCNVLIEGCDCDCVLQFERLTVVVVVVQVSELVTFGLFNWLRLVLR